MPDLIRTFVAVAIDPAVVDAVSRLQNRLKKIAPQMKWVNPDNFHLTVKFLGEIPESSLPDVSLAVKSAVCGFDPFDLLFGGVGVFGSIARPRVVWVGIGEGAETLTALAKQIDLSLNAAGFPLEDRPFAAHLTLARSGRDERALPEIFGKAMNESSKAEFGRSRVGSLVIMRSELRPGGPKYSPVEVIGLSKNIEG